MSECWLPVVGYEGLYEVSSLGRVRSLSRAVVTKDRWGNTRINRRCERILKPAIRKGYAGVSLSTSSGQEKIWRVNRLVLLAFVGSPPSEEATLACHRDGNPSKNEVDNLYWGTPQQNMDDCVAHGNRPYGEKHSSAKLTAAQVRVIRVQLAFGGSMNALAKEYGVTTQAIRAIKTWLSWRHVA